QRRPEHPGTVFRHSPAGPPERPGAMVPHPGLKARSGCLIILGVHMQHFRRLTPIALALRLLLGSPLTQAGATGDASAATTPPQAPLPLDELRTFAEVLDRIKAAYVEPVDDKTLLENAIKGMLSNLDPHSAYLEPEAFAELQESTSGEFGGLGIEVGT